jgi:hypothetical protein
MVFQLAEDYVPPVCLAPVRGEQRTMMLLDIEADDLEAAVADAVARVRGARSTSRRRTSGFF